MTEQILIDRSVMEQPAEQEPVAWRRRERGGEWQYFGWQETGMTHELVARWNKDGFVCEAIPAPQPAIPPGYKLVPVAWDDAQRICDLPAVDDAIRALIENQTNDNAVCVVQAILAEAPQPTKQPLTREEIFDLAEPFGEFQYGDAQGDKRIYFARAIIAAYEQKNGIGGQV